MYKLNRVGDRQLPCLSPFVIKNDSLLTRLLFSVCAEYSLKSCCIILIVVGDMFMCLSSAIVCVRCVFVKALSKSRKIAPQPCAMCVFTMCMHVCGDLLGVKPCWLGPAICDSAEESRLSTSLLMMRVILFSSAMGLRELNVGGYGVFGLIINLTSMLK